MGVRGPKSALTDFLDEQGIKINYTNKKQKEDTNLIYNKKNKKTYSSQPFETLNNKNNISTLEANILEKIILNYKNLKFTQKSLIIFSDYLSRNRKMNVEFFNFLTEKMSNHLKILDISKIKEEFLFFNKKFKKIQFNFCGTLTESALNFLIENNKPEELILSGAFQIKNVNLNDNLKVLCLEDSKIFDSFIEKINLQFTTLKDLSLKNCLNLENSTLKVNVENLNLSNTKLKGTLFGDFISLDVSNTQLQLPNKLTKIKKLNISETSINQLNLPDCCEYLNVSGCYRLEDLPFNCNLKFLNVSNCKFGDKIFLQLKKFKNLEFLDLSFTNVNDELVIELVECTNVNEILVFGCFNLTEKLVLFSLENILKVKIVGHPKETNFLLKKTEIQDIF